LIILKLKNDVYRAIKAEDTEARAHRQEEVNCLQQEKERLGSFLKTVKLQASRMSKDKLFHIHVAATWKARLSINGSSLVVTDT
jgi:hypothetical protein